MTDKHHAVESAWFALCGVDELDGRAIYHTELAGNELVVWRTEGGAVNVWENRCPHRGVRLSLGHHRGDALQCQYHGWQFGTGNGACRFVPAHPEAPPPAVAVKRWPVQVRYGFVWTCLTLPGELPPFTPIGELENEASPGTVHVQTVRLRTVAIDAASDAVQRALADYRFDYTGVQAWQTSDCVAFEVAPHAVLIEQLDEAAHRVVFLVQPAREGRAYLHGIALGPFAANQRLAVLRHHQQRLNALRDTLEQQCAQRDCAHRGEVANMRQRDVPGPVMATPGQPVILQRPVSKPVAVLSSGAGRAAYAGEHHAANRAFTVHLSRSGQTVNVAANVTVLNALRAHGVEVPSSCEQGVCGTCRTRVLQGMPLHRDDFLTPQEHAAGDCMMVCVSRAASDTLTLDL